MRLMRIVYSLLGTDGPPLVDGLSDDIHDAAQGLGTHGDPDWSTGVQNLLPTYQTLGTVHGDCADGVLPLKKNKQKNRRLFLGTIVESYSYIIICGIIFVVTLN